MLVSVDVARSGRESAWSVGEDSAVSRVTESKESHSSEADSSGGWAALRHSYISLHSRDSLLANLAGEGAGDAAEDEHDEELKEGEGGAGQQEDVVLVVVVAVPELVVVAGLLQYPPRQEVGVEHQHRHGLHQPQPRQHRVVLTQGDHQQTGDDETHNTFTNTQVNSQAVICFVKIILAPANAMVPMTVVVGCELVGIERRRGQPVQQVEDSENEAAVDDIFQGTRHSGDDSRLPARPDHRGVIRCEVYPVTR